jgi:hypothetical protein
MEAYTLWWNGGIHGINVGLQHKVLPNYGQLYIIAGRGARHGRANTTCRL